MARPGEGARETLAVGERGESIPLPQNWTRAGEDREEQEHDDLKTAGESGRDLTGVNPTAIPVPDGHQDPRGASPASRGIFCSIVQCGPRVSSADPNPRDES